MYNFKHQTHERERFKTYELYNQRIEQQPSFYKSVRNTLFFTLFMVSAFMTGALSLKKYQEYHTTLMTSEQILLKTNLTDFKEKIYKVSHLQFTTAITNSVVRNLQSKKTTKPIENDELKRIIKKVISKVQEKPRAIRYTQK